MTRLLHISSSPRGKASQSLALARVFTEAYRRVRPGAHLAHWDLWDGALPKFGSNAAEAKMATIAGRPLSSEQEVAYRQTRKAFERFAAADHYLFSVPMWNATVPYILKQFIDVVSQPGMVFAFDPDLGYTGLLRGRKAVVIYTSSVWAPGRPPSFGSNFQQPYLEDWLHWTGIQDVIGIALPAAVPGRDQTAVQRGVQDAIANAAAAV